MRWITVQVHGKESHSVKTFKYFLSLMLHCARTKKILNSALLNLLPVYRDEGGEEEGGGAGSMTKTYFGCNWGRN